MPLVTGLDVPPENEELFYKALVYVAHYSGDRIEKRDVVFRKRNFTTLIARSPFQGLANLWNSLTWQQKLAWDDAGVWAGLNGWQMFVQDTQYRIDNSIVGLATPSLYHQFKVGKINIEAPAESIKIKQVYQNIPATSFDYFINWKHYLTSTGGGSYAKLKATIRTGYWLDDLPGWEIVISEIDLLESFWNYDDVYSTETMISGFNDVLIEIDIYKMRGVLYIDGIEMNYNDENHAPDYQCDDFGANWQPVSVPSGATYQSVYPPDNI